MENTHSLIAQRLAKLADLRAKGIDPFANHFTPSETCQQALLRYETDREVALAGRILSHRIMGKSQFLHIKDQTGKIQLYGQKQRLGQSFEMLKHLDLGDIIGVRGGLFTTRTGERSVKLDSFIILSKALRPPPEKFHGLADTEIRYRQRYLDLIANDEVKNLFLKRSEIIREMRSFLHDRGFIEVETPIMQSIPGGASAQPFITHHHALGCRFYLRIALELYLKRLLVGGLDRVFEIGRNFRNEGISRRHNPEFTMLEAYQAYADYEAMMELVCSMIRQIAQKVTGSLLIKRRIEKRNADNSNAQNDHDELHDSKDSKYQNDDHDELHDSNDSKDQKDDHDLHNDHSEVSYYTIDLSAKWRRFSYKQLICEKMGEDWFDISSKDRRAKARDLGMEIRPDEEDFEVTQAIFEKLVEPSLIQPTFVTHLPKELVPLAKISRDDPSTVEAFECCIGGQEIAPAYSEQNDPIVQKEMLTQQAGGEMQKIDEDFLTALEHGMPPTGGMGLGVDRLCMLLLRQDNIRDVILFPQMKPKNQ